MEIESEDGDSVALDTTASVTEIGRKFGFCRPSSDDRTVSRRHLSLSLAAAEDDDPRGELRVSFEVVGKNPVLVCAGAGSAPGKNRIYRNSEKGELRAGDRFSLSLKRPKFWIVKRREDEVDGEVAERRRVFDAVLRREKRTQERRKEKAKEEEKAKDKIIEVKKDEAIEEVGNEDEGAVVHGEEMEWDAGNVEISHIDPVQEFGFLVKGHEFDRYPRQKIRPAEDWNWFLENSRGRNDEEDDVVSEDEGSSLKMKRRTKKQKRSEENDDEWTSESDNDKGNVGEVRSVERSKYSTRSQDLKRPRKDAITGKREPPTRRVVKHREDEEDEEEEDETLGGFIVEEDEEEGEGEELDEENEEEEEEEEFDDNDEEDD